MFPERIPGRRSRTRRESRRRMVRSRGFSEKMIFPPSLSWPIGPGAPETRFPVMPPASGEKKTFFPVRGLNNDAIDCIVIAYECCFVIDSGTG